MKLLVVGTPGAGKTALVKYARKAGYDNFYDTDAVKGLCEWRNYKTGHVIGPVETVKPVGGEVWYKTNGWYWKKSKMKGLLAQEDNVVICGSADNVADYYKDFDKILLFYKSRQDIVHNLLFPGREQQNGKDIEHHDRIMKWQEKLLETTKQYNPILLTENSTKQTFNSVMEVLSGSSQAG